MLFKKRNLFRLSLLIEWKKKYRFTQPNTRKTAVFTYELANMNDVIFKK